MPLMVLETTLTWSVDQVFTINDKLTENLRYASGNTHTHTRAVIDRHVNSSKVVQHETQLFPMYVSAQRRAHAIRRAQEQEEQHTAGARADKSKCYSKTHFQQQEQRTADRHRPGSTQQTANHT